MKKMLKTILLLSFHVVFSQKITISQAINIIGKQSMLTQRVGKDKIYLSHITQESTKGSVNSGRELISSVIQFEKNIEILKSANLTTEIQEDLIHLELLWIGYKQSIESTNTRTILKVIDYNNVILKVCNEINDKLLTDAKINKLYPYRTSNTLFSEATIGSNKLKYLSQRLALFYSAYFFNEKKYDGEVFTGIMNDIEKNITKIKDAEDINTDIKKSTDDIILQWKNVKTILNNEIKINFISKHNSPKTDLIFEECNKLLHHADLLTRTYNSSNDINKI